LIKVKLDVANLGPSAPSSFGFPPWRRAGRASLLGRDTSESKEQLQGFFTLSADLWRKSTTNALANRERDEDLASQRKSSLSPASRSSRSRLVAVGHYSLSNSTPSLESYSLSPALLTAGRRPSPPSLLSRLVGSRLKTVCCQSSRGSIQQEKVSCTRLQRFTRALYSYRESGAEGLACLWRLLGHDARRV